MDAGISLISWEAPEPEMPISDACDGDFSQQENTNRG